VEANEQNYYTEDQTNAAPSPLSPEGIWDLEIVWNNSTQRSIHRHRHEDLKSAAEAAAHTKTAADGSITDLSLDSNRFG
jgi:hypothetical protein